MSVLRNLWPVISQDQVSGSQDHICLHCIDKTCDITNWPYSLQPLWNTTAIKCHLRSTWTVERSRSTYPVHPCMPCMLITY